MEYDRRIISVTAVISLIVGVLDGISPLLSFYFLAMGKTESEIATYSAYLGSIRYGLHPIALFTSSYLVGRSLDVRVELRTIVTSVYLGSLLGVFAGYLLGYNYLDGLAKASISVYGGDPFHGVLGGLFSPVSAVGLFFVGFSAIAIARLRRSSKLAS